MDILASEWERALEIGSLEIVFKNRGLSFTRQNNNAALYDRFVGCENINKLCDVYCK